MDRTNFPFARPVYVMAKPAGALCNMRCAYCYYLEKSRGADAGSLLMPDDVLETFIIQYISCQTAREVLFTWHGGEPFLMSLPYYNKVVRMQERHARGHVIDNCIQTNGSLITDDWCRFLRDNGWLVGVSIDGPREMHNRYRRLKGGGESFDEVMRGIGLLDKYGVQWNAMAAVSSCNVGRPLEFYRFFKSIGCRYIQFTPVVERYAGGSGGLASPDERDGEMTPQSVTPGQWGDFLCTLFDEWVRNDVGEYFIQLFDATLANWCGVEPGVCSLAATCGHAGVLEHNGDLYSCDHFVFPEYRLGNIRENSITEMMYGERQAQFGLAKSSSLPGKCRRCKYLFACHGECPKNRFATADGGEPGLNYLCPGYYRYFSHAAPYMDFMRREWLGGRPASNVMTHCRLEDDFG